MLSTDGAMADSRRINSGTHPFQPVSATEAGHTFLQMMQSQRAGSGMFLHQMPAVQLEGAADMMIKREDSAR